MATETGKLRNTLAANTKQLFRIIQSIPSKKAEPFKLWLAEVAKQRLDQLHDPDLSIWPPRPIIFSNRQLIIQITLLADHDCILAFCLAGNAIESLLFD
jgi:hypothetical protein